MKVTRPEILPLTGIRGIAALWVVFCHYYEEWEKGIPLLAAFYPVVGCGFLGVDLFFLLSGFILGYVYEAGQTGWTLRRHGIFLRARLARIYPNHLVTLLILVLIVLGAGISGHSLKASHYPWENLPAQFFLVQAWPWTHGPYWNYPAWSVSAEWFAYLIIFPLGCRVLKHKGSVATNVLAVGLLMSAWIGLFHCLPLVPYPALWHVSLEFMAGMFLYALWKQKPTGLAFLQCWGDGVLLAILGVLYFWPREFPGKLAVTVLLFPLLLLGLSGDRGGYFWKLLARPAMNYLGRISYAVYLVHAVLQKLFKGMTFDFTRAEAGSVGAALWVIFQLGSILASAALLYHFVEVPCRRMLRK